MERATDAAFESETSRRGLKPTLNRMPEVKHWDPRELLPSVGLLQVERYQKTGIHRCAHFMLPHARGDEHSAGRLSRITVNHPSVDSQPRPRDKAAGQLEITPRSFVSVLGHMHSARQVRVSRIC